MLQRREQAEIDELLAEDRARIGRLSERELLVAGTALNAGEGAKGDGRVKFANSDPRMVALFRRATHTYDCPAIVYPCSRTHRSVMGLVHALLSCDLTFPG